MTNNAIIIAVVLAVVFLFGGFIFYNGQQQRKEQELITLQKAQQETAVRKEEEKMAQERKEKAAMMAKQLKVSLKELNNSNESGTALLKETDGKTEVLITLSEEEITQIQPAHIHKGSCPGVGTVLFPLQSVEKGISITTVSATLSELKNELPLAINVHKSSSQISTYVACGEFPASESASITPISNL